MESETGQASWACELIGHTEPDKLKGPVLGLCSITVLKFLIILSWNVCFVSEVQWNNGPYAQPKDTRTYMQYLCSLSFLPSPPPVHRTFKRLYEHRIPGEPKCTGVR